MIRIFPGSSRPNELAEGALILFQGDTPFLSFTRPGVALGMKDDNRVAVNDLVDPSRMGADYTSRETYQGVELYWSTKVTAVCDTLAEVNVLVRRTEDARQKLAAFVAELDCQEAAVDGESHPDPQQ
jgi:hypothetical protein